MIFRDVFRFQELMFSASVRNMMIFMTLPYSLAQDMWSSRMRASLADKGAQR